MRDDSFTHGDGVHGPHLPSLNEGGGTPDASQVPEAPTYIWDVKNFSKLGRDKICSDVFELDNHVWRVLLFPLGHPNHQYFNDEIAVYLEAADHATNPEGWRREVHFCLQLLHPTNPAQNIKHEVTNIFSAKEVDWGFTRFAPLSKIRTTYGPDDTIRICVEAKVLKEGVYPPLGRGFNYVHDSKKETGCVGLKNQGATCYMNSLLQALFHISAFRRAVYSMPTDADDQNKTSSIALALQRIFYRLQVGNKSVGTKELTKAFGWDARDAFTQHDVQELNRVLCDTLERKMKGTPAEGIIEKLFRGKTTSYIQCINIDYTSSRVEEYYDLSLIVKGCKDVYASFEQYVEVEVLEGANQYHAEGHGLQDAKKGCRFESFPPVLQLQFKRFEYDPYRDANVKLNDRYEFPAELNLSKYLSDPEAAENAVYDLYGVLVHSGDVYGGHYYAFIRPGLESQWLKFDDERVYKVSETDAIDDNYGGEDVITYNFHGKVHHSVSKKFANAYMLIYVRRSDIADLLAPVPESVMPTHLKRRFEEEEKMREEKKKEAAEAHLYTSIKVAVDEDLKKHPVEKFDLVEFENVKSHKILKKSTIKEFRAKAEEIWGIPQNRQRYWPFIRRRNKTFRPDKAYSAVDEEKAFATLKTVAQEHRVFLECVSEAEAAPEGELVPPVKENEILLFFKFFDTKERKLEFVGSRVLSSQLKPADLLQLLREFKGLPAETPLNIYEEIKPTMIEALKPDRTLHEGEITNGDIIVFEIPSDFTAPEFYEYIQQRTVVRFRKLDQPKEDVFSLELLLKMDYDTVARKVGEKLNWDPAKLRFTSHTPGTEMPRQKPIKRLQQQQTLADFLALPYYSGGYTDILYYEQLDVPLEELEDKTCVKVTWQNARGEQQNTYSIWVPKEAILADVARELLTLRQAEAQTNPALALTTGKLRIMRVVNSRIQNNFNLNHKVSLIDPELVKLRAEEEAPEEQTKEKDDVLVAVVHFLYDTPIVHYFDNPFMFLIRANETVGETKRRLKERLAIKDEEWERWRFAILSIVQNRPAYLTDDNELMGLHVAGFAAGQTYLGLEHPDTSLRKYRRPEKALVIHADK